MSNHITNYEKVHLKCEGKDCNLESDFEGDFCTYNGVLLCYNCATKPNPDDPDGFSILDREEYELTKAFTDSEGAWFIVVL